MSEYYLRQAFRLVELFVCNELIALMKVCIETLQQAKQDNFLWDLSPNSNELQIISVPSELFQVYFPWDILKDWLQPRKPGHRQEERLRSIILSTGIISNQRSNYTSLFKYLRTTFARWYRRVRKY